VSGRSAPVHFAQVDAFLGHFVERGQFAQALHDFNARPEAFDVVVTDLSMPGMSGFELARGVLATRPDIPLLMTSGYVRPQDEEAAHNIGVRAVILKPNTVDDLGKMLDRLFQERES